MPFIAIFAIFNNINQSYSVLNEYTVQVQKSTFSISKAFNIFKNFDFGPDPCQIKNYIKNRFDSNDIKNIIEMNNKEISPDLYVKLRLSQSTTSSVERSFSMLKNLLRENRNFKNENIGQYAILYFNKS